MAALTNVVLLAVLVIAGVAAVVFLRLGGSEYYGTPVAARGYTKWHTMLRPSGTVGELFGIGGFALILVTFIYTIRKKLGGTRGGSMKVWLEVHIFCGIVGPAFITLHTSFKFSGVISVAYWSMVLVVLSGFVGRYLFIRIPKTIRGTELSLAEIEERVEEIREDLADLGLPAPLLASIEAFDRERAGFAEGIRERLALRRLRRALTAAGVAPNTVGEVTSSIAERRTLLRRIRALSRTKKLFDLWHVFHKPLVYLMLAIAALHVGLAIYFGYSFPGAR